MMAHCTGARRNGTGDAYVTKEEYSAATCHSGLGQRMLSVMVASQRDMRPTMASLMMAHRMMSS